MPSGTRRPLGSIAARRLASAASRTAECDSRPSTGHAPEPLRDTGRGEGSAPPYYPRSTSTRVRNHTIFSSVKSPLLLVSVKR